MAKSEGEVSRQIDNKSILELNIHSDIADTICRGEQPIRII